MEIIYTSHLGFRLKIRKIPYDLPRRIYQQAKERYYDNLTKHYAGVHKVKFKGKVREMVLIYDKRKDLDLIELITIHPIKPYQKYSRINSGRWRKL